jgi:cytoskeletal protein RodZ
MDIGAELKAKMGPFPLYVWLLAMTAVGVVFFLLKKKKSGSATTGTPGTACTQSDGSAGTWDSTGTVCQASTVSTVNADNSTTSSAGDRNWRAQSSTATATTTAATTAAASTPAAAASTTPPASTPVTTTGTGNPNSGNWSFPAPAGLKVTGASKTSTQIKISWNAVKGPAGQIPATYEVRIFRGGQQIRENAVPGTSYTESGLSKGTTGLTVNVWANGGPIAPAHATAST